MSVNIGPDELETFLAVAELRSFWRAAERLGVSQPSVTSRIQRLERVLGVALLGRTTRRVTVTEAGERLRQQAQRTVDELQSLLREFREEVELERGRVVIGSVPTVAATILPPIIARFMQRWPDVAIVVRDDFGRLTVERVSSGEVDLALVPYDEDNRSLDFVPLLRDDFYLVAPLQHSLAQRSEVAFAEIEGYPLLCMPRDAAVWETVARAFEADGLTFRPAFQAHSLFTLLGLVEAGVGLTLLPRIILPRVNLSAVAVVRISGKSLYRTIGIVTAHGRMLGPAADAFVRALRTALPPYEALPPLLPGLLAAQRAEAGPA